MPAEFDKIVRKMAKRFKHIYALHASARTGCQIALQRKKYAERESCVIVGRCADYALSDNPDCINIFIHADMDKRVKIISQRANITESKARDLIQKQDKQRASYYNYYTSKKWGDSQSYHLTLDSGKLGIDGCIDMILKFREILDASR